MQQLPIDVHHTFCKNGVEHPFPSTQKRNLSRKYQGWLYNTWILLHYNILPNTRMYWNNEDSARIKCLLIELTTYNYTNARATERYHNTIHLYCICQVGFSSTKSTHANIEMLLQLFMHIYVHTVSLRKGPGPHVVHTTKLLMDYSITRLLSTAKLQTDHSYSYYQHPCRQVRISSTHSR